MSSLSVFINELRCMPSIVYMSLCLLWITMSVALRYVSDAIQNARRSAMLPDVSDKTASIGVCELRDR